MKENALYGLLPFSRYKNGGSEELGKPRSGDGTSRHGYGADVLEQCGTACVYCGRELAEPYEAWLDLSVDHVVPAETIKRLGYLSQWVDDLINLVTCCRACNEFLNGYRVREPAPESLNEFLNIRDQAFGEKRRRARGCHERERETYGKWLATRGATVPLWRRAIARLGTSAKPRRAS